MFTVGILLVTDIGVRDPATTGPEIEALKQSIAKYFKIKQWDKEGWIIASAPTIARQLKMTTLPEFALSFEAENKLKTPDSMRTQGTQILRGTYEYLKSVPPRAK